MLKQYSQFRGEMPRANKRLLPDTYAQVAVNTRMEDGALAPVRTPSFVTDLVTPRQTVYLNDTTWLAWATPVDVLPGPTATDRIYITGDGAPQMWADDTYYPLALPAPVSGPTIANMTAPDPDRLETILYAFTWVTSYGEESAPSPLSNELEWSEGVVVNLTNIPVPPAGRAIDTMRIYRSVTSASGITDLYFVADRIPAATFDHDIALIPVGEPISTASHNTPPDTLRGIISMPNGMMVGHTDRELHFCEPYQPHAWPVAYSLLVDYDIVGLAAFGSQLSVMTKGTPYRGQGSHPETFQLEKIEEMLPCVAKRSIVDLGYAAAYASTDGLVLVTASGARLITKPLFTSEQWHKMTPATIRAAHSRGRYFFGFDGVLPTGDEQTGMIDLTGDQPFFLRVSETVKALYHDLRTGKMFYQAADDQLYVWDDLDAAGFMDMEWRSAPLDLGFDISFAALYIEGTASGAWACNVVADGVVKATITTLNKPVRLPAGFKSAHWALEITGQVAVDTVAIATALGDLAQLA